MENSKLEKVLGRWGSFATTPVFCETCKWFEHASAHVGCAQEVAEVAGITVGLMQLGYYGNSSGKRHYHSLAHVGHMLDEFCAYRRARLNSVVAPAKIVMAIKFAIWFHDLILDPKQKGNEEKSAGAARMFLGQIGVDEKTIDFVERLIIATKHDPAVELVGDEKLIVDLDLAIFGQDPEVYDWYAQGIRKEYSFVPDDNFKEGRIAVLLSFLRREHIYNTAYFRKKYEKRARANLKRELLALGWNDEMLQLAVRGHDH